MRIKTDMDKYKKILSLLQSSVPFPSPPGVGPTVPPGSTRRRQSRARAQHKYQYKIKRNS